MEQFVEEGKIRSIGLSNWYVEELTEFLPQVDTVPALVQNEIYFGGRAAFHDECGLQCARCAL